MNLYSLQEQTSTLNVCTRVIILLEVKCFFSELNTLAAVPVSVSTDVSEMNLCIKFDDCDTFFRKYIDHTL